MFVEKTGYIVSRHTREVNGHIEMSLFIKTPEGTVKVLPDRQLSVFFTNAPLQSLPNDMVGVQCSESALKSFNNEPVILVQSTSLTLHQQMINLVKRNGFSVFEEDIKAHNRYLMERKIRGAVRFIGVADLNNQTFRQARVIAGNWQPDWNVWSLDIETSVSTNTLLSIGITSRDQRVAFVVTDQENSSPIIHRFSDEKSLLLAFIRYVRKHSPDIFIGWNLIGFDLQFIDQRCQVLGIRPAFGVNGENWNIRSSDNQGKYFASIPGRVALDGIALLKVGGYHFESYSLNNVSNEILDDGKLLHGGERWQEIERLHREDLNAFVAYNLQDCDLVMRIFEKLKLIELQQTRVDLTGIPFEQTGGSVAAFENLYLPRLHTAGWVAPAWSDDDFVASPGGFVMSSIPGLYKNVLVFDFKSLYPSIIRTFHVDPLARITAQYLSSNPVKGTPLAAQLVPGFLGASFNRQQAILPSLVGELAQAREEAKRVGNGILSYAIKIIMNSFYGVLGSNVCRFYHAELASSITMRGHELLGRTQAWMEERGARVIYGDTDSLFVTLNSDLENPQKQGEQLRDDINACLSRWCNEYAQLDSHLELEFERVYERFFMPTIRGQEEGSKKRYAGKSKGELVFKGLEAARTDWTPLARQFQRALFEKIFNDENPIVYIQQTVETLRAGGYDEQLVYSKQLSRPLSSYTKNKPPHVRAAAIIDQKRAEQGLPLEYNKGRKRVYYFYQRTGVVPYESAEDLIDLDYEHYIEKQIEPIADSILPFFKTNMASLLSQQISLL
ncbi:DNA polymerase II [Marinomonas rhizomae]|uniref:DNA polymerase n=1 Tax=Marinomonas rhizomae TaxID=491948 RepID=A0A366JE58_9GAMM|nr:DNA polymerase II [Marinomonas rhizomae]RBP84730.1 DNA damage-inducible DNA polymerase II [Marinomonas rhizomae]RNF75071.1 DNA polymerase II [Marinomonas rhizomae]